MSPNPVASPTERGGPLGAGEALPVLQSLLEARGLPYTVRPMNEECCLVAIAFPERQEERSRLELEEGGALPPRP